MPPGRSYSTASDACAQAVPLSLEGWTCVVLVTMEKFPLRLLKQATIMDRSTGLGHGSGIAGN